MIVPDTGEKTSLIVSPKALVIYPNLYPSITLSPALKFEYNKPCTFESI